MKRRNFLHTLAATALTLPTIDAAATPVAVELPPVKDWWYDLHPATMLERIASRAHQLGDPRAIHHWFSDGSRRGIAMPICAKTGPQLCSNLGLPQWLHDASEEPTSLVADRDIEQHEEAGSEFVYWTVGDYRTYHVFTRSEGVMCIVMCRDFHTETAKANTQRTIQRLTSSKDNKPFTVRYIHGDMVAEMLKFVLEKPGQPYATPPELAHRSVFGAKLGTPRTWITNCV